ncbi:MAG: hypothetical protein ACLTDX_22400 [[Clostridium] innocuum]
MVSSVFLGEGKPGRIQNAVEPTVSSVRKACAHGSLCGCLSQAACTFSIHGMHVSYIQKRLEEAVIRL